MNTRSNKSNDGKSVNMSSIVTEYLNVSLSKMLNTWFQIDSRDEKNIVENLKGPIVELLLQRYE